MRWIAIENKDAGTNGVVESLAVMVDDILRRLRQFAAVNNNFMVEYMEHDDLLLDTRVNGMSRGNCSAMIKTTETR
jgi:hypothetical protein